MNGGIAAAGKNSRVGAAEK